LDFVVALYHGIPPYIKAFVDQYVSDDKLVWIWPPSDIVEAPCFIVPSMMQIDYTFHPEMNRAVEDFCHRILGPTRPGHGGRRIYLSRTKVRRSWHWLENEAEVEQVVLDHGFEVVNPEQLPLVDQMQIMREAGCLLSEYSSASHNSLFCLPGTKVGVINYINACQSRIAALRRQPMAILPPEDGNFRQDSRRRSPFSADRAAVSRLCIEFFDQPRK
jgi:capsular polysaccharide biosynthesis protein